MNKLSDVKIADKSTERKAAITFLRVIVGGNVKREEQIGKSGNQPSNTYCFTLTPKPFTSRKIS